VRTRLAGRHAPCDAGMRVTFHPHTLARMRERGASEDEVLATIASGEQMAASRGRVRFRKAFGPVRRARRRWDGKEVVAWAEAQDDVWLVVTVVVAYRRDRKETHT
jgi:hypothetical protein